MDTEAFEALSVEHGWKELVAAGLRARIALLRSDEFLSTGEASRVQGVSISTIQRQIRSGRLLALRLRNGGPARIPTWALDSSFSGLATSTLLEVADQWQLYNFLTTAHANLKGLCPFELLVSKSFLTPSSRGRREELRARYPANLPLLTLVREELEADVHEQDA